MSELKSYIAPTADGTGLADYYLKSEADKVIAELKEENEKLKATPEQIMKEVFDKCLIYPKEMVRLDDAYKLTVSLRKQKYKRCLAMSDLCHWKMVIFDYKKDKSDFYYRWHKRWLKIAEKFKEAK